MPSTNDIGEPVTIALIKRPRGIRGEVMAELLTDFPDRFDGLGEVMAVDEAGRISTLNVENAWPHKGRMVLKFRGIDSVELADTLRNVRICVPESDIVELDDDEYYDWQLAGLTVMTVDGTAVGQVKELMRTGGTDLLVVKGEREHLIPFAAAICTEVDLDNGVVTIDPPDGLLDL